MQKRQAEHLRLTPERVRSLVDDQGKSLQEVCETYAPLALPAARELLLEGRADERRRNRR